MYGICTLLYISSNIFMFNSIAFESSKYLCIVHLYLSYWLTASNEAQLIFLLLFRPIKFIPINLIRKISISKDAFSLTFLKVLSTIEIVIVFIKTN